MALDQNGNTVVKTATLVTLGVQMPLYTVTLWSTKGDTTTQVSLCRTCFGVTAPIGEIEMAYGKKAVFSLTGVLLCCQTVV